MTSHRLLRASVALALAASALRVPALAQNAPNAAPILTTRFTYKATIPAVPKGTKAVNVWLPLPSDSEWQTVRDLQIESSLPHRITRESRFGNRIVYLHGAPSSTPLAVTVSFTVARKAVELRSKSRAAMNPLPGDAKETEKRLLQSDRLVPIGGRYGEIAREVTAGKTTPTEKMQALFEHVVATMQYDYKKESPKLGEGDVAFVCDYKKGNCSDLHSYLISLARSLQIPAVLEYGFPLTGIPVPSSLPTEGTLGGYHCWMWFHDPAQGWLPLDASDARRWLDSQQPETKNALFGNLVLERSAVVLSRGRDITLEPAQKGRPLNNFISPYAEADGKPIEGKGEMHFRLLHIGS
jgi:transglutaminase-like putative cysteine protease